MGTSRPNPIHSLSTWRRRPSRQLPASRICCWISSKSAWSRPSAKNFSPSRIWKRRLTLNRSRSASLSSTSSDVYGVMMWYSSDRAMISSLIAGDGPLVQQGVQVHASPQPRNERIALLGVLQRHLAAEPHRLARKVAGDHHFARLVGALGQIAAQEDLLRAGRPDWAAAAG